MQKTLSDKGLGSRQAPRRSGRSRSVGIVLSLLLAAQLLSSAAPPASADDYDASMAGHPLRIVAYVLHPVGVLIDYLIMRPAHWLASHEPIQTLVGHED